MRVCSAGEKNSSYIRIHGSSYQDSFAQSTRGYGEGLFYESPKGPAISPPHPLHPPPPTFLSAKSYWLILYMSWRSLKTKTRIVYNTLHAYLF